MKLKTEVAESSHNVLIVSKLSSFLTQQLKNELKKYGNNVFFTPKIPISLNKFTYCFFINEELPLERFINHQQQKIIFIFTNKISTAQNYANKIRSLSIKDIKIVNINNPIELKSENIHNILWFSLSKSTEIFLNLFQPLQKKTPIPKNVNKLNLYEKIFNKKLLLLTILYIFLFHLLFIFPLLTASFFYYQSSKFLKDIQIEKTRQNLTTANSLMNISKKLYAFPRQTFQLFSISTLPDNIFQINEKVNIIVSRSLQLYVNSQEIIRLFTKKNKEADETKLLIQRLSKIQNDLENLNEDLFFLNQKLPSFLPILKKIKKDISQINENLEKIKQILPLTDSLLAKDSEKKYLLLFANNMEIRPGGGFIGSFGILIIKNLTLKEIKIYDVYDADGQLLAHIEPPESIRKYLNQPHWFLRDSAYSPDFPENYTIAKSFIDKEMQLTDFSGGLIITTTAIKYLLSAFNNVYLSDYKELITPENFYLKAQVYSEKNFFPGSTQKKGFLSSLARHLTLDLENISVIKFFQNLKKSFDEKQMAVYFDSETPQKLIDSLYWSGKIISSECPENVSNCYADYFFPFDSNLGVNKSNFFITRIIESSIFFDKEGYVHNKTIIKFKNEATGDIFPGGNYKNYFQIYLPTSSLLKQLTKNDILIEDYDIKTNRFKEIGFLLEIKPKESVEIKIEYQSTTKLEKGKAYYQFLIQKQIGATNSDFDLRINLPSNIKLLNQNFSPLVKNEQILYNSQLSTDKIFFIELLKE